MRLAALILSVFACKLVLCASDSSLLTLDPSKELPKAKSSNPEVKSSSSKKKRNELTLDYERCVGTDENPESNAIACGLASITNSITRLEADKVRYPRDLLLEDDESYRSKTPVKSAHKKQSSSLDRMLAKKDFMARINSDVLRGKLELEGSATACEAIKILTSPHFNGIGLEYLNDLPLIYLTKRSFSPYEAFLKRFQYADEYTEILKEYCIPDYKSPEAALTTPFTILSFAFLKPHICADPAVEKFFACLVKTQKGAFLSAEPVFFDYWLRGGQQSWKYLRIYFGNSASHDQSYNLATLITKKYYLNLLNQEMVQFILSIAEFDVNVRLEYAPSSKSSDDDFDFVITVMLSSPETEEDGCGMIPFFHRLVYNPAHSKLILPHVLKHPKLDVTVPTGKIFIEFQGASVIEYNNLSILYLAVLMANVTASNHLYDHPDILNGTETKEFVILIIKYSAVIFFSLIRQFLRSIFYK